jgi:hypothetical protein
VNYIPAFEYVDLSSVTQNFSLTLPQAGDPLKERYRVNGRESRSNSGKSQFQFNYIDNSYSLDLFFLTKTEIDELKAMFDNVGQFGKTFKYFPSSDEVDFFTVYWDAKRFDPVRTIASAGDFIYDFKMNMRVAI